MITNSAIPSNSKGKEAAKPAEVPSTREMEHRTDILASMQQANTMQMCLYIQTIVLLDCRELLWQLAGRPGLPGQAAPPAAKPARKRGNKAPAI